MKKTFIPKFIGLTEQEINSRISWLKEKFSSLQDNNAEEIKYWNNSKSGYTGTIISENEQCKCSPYNKDKLEFKKEYPEGEVLELNFLPIKLSEVILDTKVRERVRRQMSENRHIVLVHRHFDGRMWLVVGHFYITTPHEFCANFFPIDTTGDINALKKEAEKHKLVMPKGYGYNKGQWLTLMERSFEITGWKPREEIRIFS